MGAQLRALNTIEICDVAGVSGMVSSIVPPLYLEIFYYSIVSADIIQISHIGVSRHNEGSIKGSP